MMLLYSIGKRQEGFSYMKKETKKVTMGAKVGGDSLFESVCSTLGCNYVQLFCFEYSLLEL